MTRISMQGCMPVRTIVFEFVKIDPTSESFLGFAAPIILKVNDKIKAIALTTLNSWLLDYPKDVELLKAREAI